MAARQLKKTTSMARSEVISVRLDPKLRFGAEIAARKQRRTLSSLIEWAVQTALESYRIRDYQSQHDEGATTADALNLVWDTEEADRFAKLAFHFPELLTFDEQKLWKLVAESGYFWRGGYNKSDEWTWVVHIDNLIFARVRDKWDTLKKIVSGEIGKDSIPKVVSRPKDDTLRPEQKKGNEYLEDDIPF